MPPHLIESQLPRKKKSTATQHLVFTPRARASFFFFWFEIQPWPSQIILCLVASGSKWHLPSSPWLSAQLRHQLSQLLEGSFTPLPSISGPAAGINQISPKLLSFLNSKRGLWLWEVAWPAQGLLIHELVPISYLVPAFHGKVYAVHPCPPTVANYLQRLARSKWFSTTQKSDFVKRWDCFETRLAYAKQNCTI